LRTAGRANNARATRRQWEGRTPYLTQGGNLARDRGFTVSLMGAGLNVQGVVLCNQIRVLDLNARGARLIEKAQQDVVDKVMSKVAPLFG